MVESADIRRFRVQVIDHYRVDEKPELSDFAGALGSMTPYTVYPGGMRVRLPEVVKLKPETVVDLGGQQRMVVPAELNGYPVVITHQYPVKPPLLQKLMIFGEQDLITRLDLRLGASARLSINRVHFAYAHVWDWARSIHTLLDSGIDR